MNGRLERLSNRKSQTMDEHVYDTDNSNNKEHGETDDTFEAA